MKDYIINTHALHQLAPGGAEYNIRSKHVSKLGLELRSVFSLYGMPRSYSSLAPLRSLARVDNDIVSTFNVWYEYKQALLSKTSKKNLHNKVLDKSVGDLHHSLYCLFNERVRTQETEELQRRSVFENTVHSGSQGDTGGFAFAAAPSCTSTFNTASFHTVSQGDITGTSQVPFHRVMKLDGDECITFNSITAVPDYECAAKSFEELRWEDYQDGNYGSATFVDDNLFGTTPPTSNISGTTPASTRLDSSTPSGPSVGVQSPLFSPLGHSFPTRFDSAINGAAPASRETTD